MAANADYVIVPSTQEMYDLLRPGLPIRWLNGTVDQGWSYGVIETFEDEGTQAKFTYSGVPMLVSATALEVGPPEALRRISVSVPGVFAAAPSSGLILGINKTLLRWAEGDAHLVRFSTVCTVSDTGSAPLVCVSIESNPVHATGLAASTGGAPPAPVYSGMNLDPAYVHTAFNQSIEIITTQGGNGDASNLTVEMLFVQDRGIDFWNHVLRGHPVLNLVISGASTGFCGMPNGIHAVVPDTYNASSWAPTLSTGATKSERMEEWVKQTSLATQVIRFKAGATRPVATPSIEGGTTYIDSTLYVKFGGSSTVSEHHNTIVPSLGGKILNRHMTSRMIGSTTFTWWKLGDLWSSAFK